MERKAVLSGKRLSCEPAARAPGRRLTLLFALGLLTCAFAAVDVTPALASCSATGTSTVTVTCTGTGAWTPPGNVTTASFTLDGAAGGTGFSGDLGGPGGRTTADSVSVSSSTTYHIVAGTKGQDGSSGGTGGSPGGGNAGSGGGGGGGASIVATGAISSDTTNWLLAAGGGGGGVGAFVAGGGGAGGGTTGGTGSGAGGGAGGDQTGASGSGVHLSGSDGDGDNTAGGGGGGFYGGGGGEGNSGGGGGSGFLAAGISGTTTQGAGSTGNGTVTITYTAPPVAIQDDYTIREDSGPHVFKVRRNDDGSPGTITSVSDPSHGTVEITNGGNNVTYTPDADYCNDHQADPPDSFTYTLNGGTTPFTTATVFVRVGCVDDPPVAVDDSYTIRGDTGAKTLKVRTNDLNPDGGRFEVISTTEASHATVAVANGGRNVTYDPDPGYCNPGGSLPLDTFTYTLNGGSTADVSVRVRCPA